MFTEEELEKFEEMHRRIIELATKIAPEYLKSENRSYRSIDRIYLDEDGYISIEADDTYCGCCTDTVYEGFSLYKLCEEGWVEKLREKSEKRIAEEKKKKELEDQKKREAAEKKKIEAARREKELYFELKKKYETG